ncbi:hypothetical protein DVH02_25820 [Streptomyces corynorhini]|uniref:Uncharacterized protein n=1 Tax=Streptomyces corynorhini TaxID=2282652 RepID=A0A370B5G3_9ACTN|nr:hypothetical protein DVH02_25820 [Streptomyces corynorhini]
MLAIIAGQGSVVPDDLALLDDAVRCELALWHADEHAAFVWEWAHDMSTALWALWKPDGAVQFESHSWCGVPEGGTEAGDACFLFLEHSREHSWETFDPAAKEAVRQARQMFPHWFW